MARVADTSFLFAAFAADDAHHARARAAFQEHDPIVVPTEILTETIHLVEHRFGADAGRQALRFLLGRPNLRVGEQVHLEAVRAVYEGTRGLSLADAFVVQACLALGAQPLSFDRRIQREVARRAPGARR